MTDTVQPALTPDEWKEWTAPRVPPAGSEFTGTWITQSIDDAMGCMFREGTRPGESAHALAALALHGQPFGFTHDDVQLLRETAAGIESDAWDASDIRSLADRIAALLPPQP